MECKPICTDTKKEVADAKEYDAQASALPQTVTAQQVNAMNRAYWQGDSCDAKDSCDVAPPGGEHVVKALKKEPGVDNPFAVAWAMKNKGQI